jgi:hypothetical protein
MNENPSCWDHWKTTYSGSSDPYNTVLDQSENHATEPDGLGYRVHVPFIGPSPAIPTTWTSIKALYR